MSKIVLVTGGARSGKSCFAQDIVSGYDNVGYIATAVITDAEMQSRVEKHRASRPAEWQTYEASKEMHTVFEKSSHFAYLVDCMTVYLTNFLFDKGCFDEEKSTTDIDKAEKEYLAHIENIVSCAQKKEGIVVFVTNEVGSGIVPESYISRVFRDMAGRANQKLAGLADEVYHVISGIPVKIKG